MLTVIAACFRCYKVVVAAAAAVSWVLGLVVATVTYIKIFLFSSTEQKRTRKGNETKYKFFRENYVCMWLFHGFMAFTRLLFSASSIIRHVQWFSGFDIP